MNKLLKIISAMFIFAFFTTTVFAEPSADIIVPGPRVYIVSVDSDASSEGILGVDDSITFTVKLNVQLKEAKIFPEEYNGGKLKWTTEDDTIFTAVYTVEKEHKNQEKPLQLENVFAKNETIRTDEVSGNDVLKTIDILKNDTLPILDLTTVNTKFNTKDIIIEGKISSPNKIIMAQVNMLDGLGQEFKADCEITEDPGTHYMSCRFTELKDDKYAATFTLKDNYSNVSIYKDITLFVNTKGIDVSFDKGEKHITNSFPSTIRGKMTLPEQGNLVSSHAALKLKEELYANCSIRFGDIFSISCTPIVPIADIGLAPGIGAPRYPDGTYTLEVTFKDDFGNTITKEQRIIVDSVAPIITLLGENVTINTGSTYVDAGATANDNREGNITSKIVVTSTVDTTTAGTYTVTYNVTDEAGNSAIPVTRIVTVNLAPTTGGGIRILPAAVPAPTEAPAQETPVEEPAPVQITEPEGNTNTGGENLTPQETPIEEVLELEETPIETPTPSGLTGFAGFASSPGGVVTIVGGALVVIGAIGYFFFLRPR